MENEIQVLTIAEIEQRNANQPKFGGGITVAAGFDLGAKAALDSRSTVKTIAERDAHVTGNRAYAGMLVFVEADGKTYQYTGTAWKEFGFNNSDFQAQVVNDLTTGGATKALSAEQGKVLKGITDTLRTDLTATNATVATKADKAGSVGQDFSTKDLTVVGNLIVQGTTTTVESANLEVTDNQILINKGETGAGVSAGHAGIRIERGTEKDYLFQYNEEIDLFQIGTEDDLETVATRPWVENITNPIKTTLGQKADKTALDAEVTRATQAESKIRTDFAAADTAITGEVNKVKGDLAAEITRAKGAESTLQTNIDTKVNKSDVVNVLDTTTAGKVLDARQGKALNDAIAATNVKVTALETSASAVDGKIATAKSEAIASAKTYTDTEVAKKADKVHVHAITDVTGLKDRLDGADSSIATLTTATNKIPGMESNIGANANAITKEIGDRQAAVSAVDSKVAALTTTVNTKASKSELTDGLALKVDSATLFSGGKIDSNLMPAIAITDTHIVASETEMLALTAQTGDVAIRTDLNKSFILKGTDPKVLANWQALLTPASDVTSVAGKKGDVILSKSDVGLENVTNESKATMFTNPTFTGTVVAPTPTAADSSTKVATTAFVKAQNYMVAGSVIDCGTF